MLINYLCKEIHNWISAKWN